MVAHKLIFNVYVRIDSCLKCQSFCVLHGGKGWCIVIRLPKNRYWSKNALHCLRFLTSNIWISLVSEQNHLKSLYCTKMFTNSTTEVLLSSLNRWIRIMRQQSSETITKVCGGLKSNRCNWGPAIGRWMFVCLLITSWWLWIPENKWRISGKKQTITVSMLRHFTLPFLPQFHYSLFPAASWKGHLVTSHQCE